MNDPLFDLSTRVALVTGSSEGIGRAMAVALARQGARVGVHGLDAQDVAATVAAITAAGGAAAGHASALDPAGAPQALVGAIEAALGPIDILVSGVAMQIRGPIAAVDPDSLARIMRLNLGVLIDLVQAATPGMTSRGWGRIIAIGSVQQERPHPEMLGYAASKSAQLNVMRNLAKQLAPFGVTCNVISPGAIATARNAGVLADPAYRQRVRAAIPLGSIGEADDLAGAAVFLASDAARYVTGIDLPVDGGMRL